eukprot:m.205856 g.205856  ORF g.205856 m.205856 type:complete len:79 (-) comp16899_c7_seq1:1-237(-)
MVPKIGVASGSRGMLTGLKPDMAAGLMMEGLMASTANINCLVCARACVCVCLLENLYLWCICCRSVRFRFCVDGWMDG